MLNLLLEMATKLHGNNKYILFTKGAFFSMDNIVAYELSELSTCRDGVHKGTDLKTYFLNDWNPAQIPH